ncbi:GNAT family N-acetyltransferase [Streptomyces alkaliterrae]|uniref:GNAT family N-acetyltransferase n=1 Tax=Streptomyces alkaliterrae TaxID=2213162 RepID=A0A5P0YPY2_9ACTN|nr:GNAT family N-acetyltransferase [Streptomyces alkaliterrae]MBB1255478.1 GNAT family N-acetyltransferase [Streptomyces alkaliterrae]MBB1261312.1 GNAT family N-acetyltransferase [Streptomyces alkaliterrae]MQS01970.1 GNAT family N-acetyltransferase [Streptomyces alkaliterrae]
MNTELRVLRPADWSAWFRHLSRAFGEGEPDPAEEAGWRSVVEYERSLAAFDGDELIGTSGTFSFRMSVPGGALVPTGGLTMVSVSATHRRRGVLTAMVRRQLELSEEREEPLAALTASEPDIYGRFGYGLASQWMSAEVDTARTRIAAPADTEDLRLRWADPEKSLPECEALYARRLGERPGLLERSQEWARVQVVDPPGDREGASPLRCVLAERDGELVGYARFSVTPRWDDAGADGQVNLWELEADDPAGYAALWRFLAGVDLTSRIVAGKRPVDDPLRHLVSDVRRCRLKLRDSMYLRPVDVGAALAARAYRAPVDVVLDVADAFLPRNAGRWRLSGDRLGAVCARTKDAADLSLDVADLGAVYLGGSALTELAAAGRVVERRPGALAAASLAFGSDRAPFLAHGF